MMFSSNQILEVSGSLHNTEYLYTALEFALKLSGYINSFTVTRKDKPSKCVYQITEDGRYCIGWAYGEVEKGWSEFPFEFDLSIISQIIIKHLQKQEIKKDIWEGSYEKGFLMKYVVDSLSDERNGIKKPFYAIVEFCPYTCFYAK